MTRRLSVSVALPAVEVEACGISSISVMVFQLGYMLVRRQEIVIIAFLPGCSQTSTVKACCSNIQASLFCTPMCTLAESLIACGRCLLFICFTFAFRVLLCSRLPLLFSYLHKSSAMGRKKGKKASQAKEEAPGKTAHEDQPVLRDPYRLFDAKLDEGVNYHEAEAYIRPLDIQYCEH